MRWLGRGIAALVAGVLAASLAFTGGAPAPALSASAPLLGGCFTDGCFFDYAEMPQPYGNLIDENTWESTGINSDNWLPLKGRFRYIFRLPFGGRVPYDATVYLSTSPNPYQTRTLVSQGTGNVAVLEFDPDVLTVYNDTCADYYVRVVAYAPPLPPAEPPRDDAGDDVADAGPRDDAGPGHADGDAGVGDDAN